MSFERTRARRVVKNGLLWLALLVVGCGKLIGVRDSKLQGACETSAECAPGYDCRTGSCVDASEVAASKGESGGGGGKGSPTTVVGNDGGEGGAATTPTSTPTRLCAADKAACDGNRATTCNADGSGYVAGGQVCVAPLVCSAGACVGGCTLKQTTCSGNSVQTCDGEGSYGTPAACPDTTPYCTDGTCKQPPSCSGLSVKCGPSSSESCCVSPLVTGDTFNRDNDRAYPATVSSFRLDKYEVNVARFRQFVSAVVAGWKPSDRAGQHVHLSGGSGLTSSTGAGSERGWDTGWNTNLPAVKATWDSTDYLACDEYHQNWTPSSGANEQLPINCVNWFQAEAFCIWDQGFLPSEAEWNYATAGGKLQRQYPWSMGASSMFIDCTYANYHGAVGGSDYCVKPGSGMSAVGALSPNGNGVYGQADLAGNVWEWNLDWSADYTSECKNCAALEAATRRVRRGGAFESAEMDLLSWTRSELVPSKRDYATGLRCARSP